ncbi:MAG TPA: guanine deaminase [Geminicoccaceae bacterium]
MARPPLRRALRGRVVDFTADPAEAGAGALRDHPDGLVIIEQGRIAAAGAASDLLARVKPGTRVDHYPGCLILPGLIDVHIHYPQTQVIASYGARLLEWLEKYTFVEEQRFAERGHAERVAAFFLDELRRNGTTTAAVYCTTHPESVDAFFQAAEARNMRTVAGKMMMDRNAPDALLDGGQRGYDQTKALIKRWHGRGRQGYAITPRFAVTSSDFQLEMTGALVREHPDCLMQTHLAENDLEIRAAAELFPWAASYTQIYDRYGLLGPRSIFGHCLHLADDEVDRLREAGAVAAFCPTSNLFIGSGLFDLARMDRAGVRVGLATDVGGGTSYSMLRTAAEAYKVLQLRGQNLDAARAFYMMTLGNARALALDDRIGSFTPGHEADVVVLDPAATPAMAHRMERAGDDLDLTLFVLMTMGDDRAVRQVYLMGEPAGA